MGSGGDGATGGDIGCAQEGSKTGTKKGWPCSHRKAENTCLGGVNEGRRNGGAMREDVNAEPGARQKTEVGTNAKKGRIKPGKRKKTSKRSSGCYRKKEKERNQKECVGKKTTKVERQRKGEKKKMKHATRC